MAVGTTDHLIYVYHIDDHGEPLEYERLEYHKAAVDSLAWVDPSPQQVLVFASGGGDGQVAVWHYRERNWVSLVHIDAAALARQHKEK